MFPLRSISGEDALPNQRPPGIFPLSQAPILEVLREHGLDVIGVDAEDEMASQHTHCPCRAHAVTAFAEQLEDFAFCGSGFRLFDQRKSQQTLRLWVRGGRLAAMGGGESGCGVAADEGLDDGVGEEEDGEGDEGESVRGHSVGQVRNRFID